MLPRSPLRRCCNSRSSRCHRGGQGAVEHATRHTRSDWVARCRRHTPQPDTSRPSLQGLPSDWNSSVTACWVEPDPRRRVANAHMALIQWRADDRVATHTDPTLTGVGLGAGVAIITGGAVQG